MTDAARLSVETAQAPLWVVLAPVVSTIFSAALSAGVAVFAVCVATRQTRNNEERLRVDFFEKRFNIWKAANDAVRQEVERISALTESDLILGNVGGQIMDRFYDSKREALYVFGPEVIDAYKDVDSAIVDPHSPDDFGTLTAKFGK